VTNKEKQKELEEEKDKEDAIEQSEVNEDPQNQTFIQTSNTSSELLAP
jgi:hypothetical protein